MAALRAGDGNEAVETERKKVDIFDRSMIPGSGARGRSRLRLCLIQNGGSHRNLGGAAGHRVIPSRVTASPPEPAAPSGASSSSSQLPVPSASIEKSPGTLRTGSDDRGPPSDQGLTIGR